jgi:uncharacterized protein (DUF342 family)
VGGKAKFMGSQAMILASKVTAGQSVEALNIGSRGSSTGNVIEVGTNPRVAERAAQLPAEIKQRESNLENLGRIISLFQQLEEQNRLPEEKKTELLKLTTTVRSIEGELTELTEEMKDVEARMKRLGFGTVKVMGTAYAGTQIFIGSEAMLLTNDQVFTSFTRSKEGIRMAPAR